MVRFLWLILLLCTTLTSTAQNAYPKNYFRNPLNIPISLAGNFGECRPNHFHSGIDIKTEGKENYPVFAAADGYISRIKMEPGGFGHALYITHPNGYTTLYAHLNDFVPSIQQYLKAQQYAAQKWTVDLSLPATKFPIKKGQQIAWSGNTGGSTAPHLHFEIRNTKTEHPLNPQLFGFAITDHISPKPYKLFVYKGQRSINLQQPDAYALSSKGNTYRPNADTLYVGSTLAGLGIHLYDYMDGSTNTLAYYTMEWYQKDLLLGKITLDDIGYDVTRYLYAYCDHSTMQRTGDWPILLFRQPGNVLEHLYSGLQNNQGKINLSNGAVPIKIIIRDAYGNASTIQFILAQGKAKPTDDCPEKVSRAASKLERNNIKVNFPAGNFYDSACLTYQVGQVENAFSQKHTVLNKNIPAQFYFDVQIKADKVVPFEERNKLAMRYSDGKKQSGKAATFADGYYSCKQRAFGDFWLVMDKTAPSISPLTPANSKLKTGQYLKFSVKESTTSVASFQVYCGKQWLCFEQRGDTWMYPLDAHCPKGTQTLKAIATDENGNESQLNFTFTHQ